MGAIARPGRDGLHESTGKLTPEGTTHVPEWSEWEAADMGLSVRQCRHPECDVDEYRATLTRLFGA